VTQVFYSAYTLLIITLPSLAILYFHLKGKAKCKMNRRSALICTAKTERPARRRYTVLELYLAVAPVHFNSDSYYCCVETDFSRFCLVKRRRRVWVDHANICTTCYSYFLNFLTKKKYGTKHNLLWITLHTLFLAGIVCLFNLCTYDLYGPVRNVFDAGRYIT
jgi:hypothetical protein